MLRPWKWLATIAGAAIGFAFSKFFGAVLFVPAVLIGITWFILSKSKVPRIAIPMMAVFIGQTLWMVVGHTIVYMSYNQIDPNVFVDLGGAAAVATWFLLRGSRAAAIGVLVVQIVELAGLALTLGETAIPNFSRGQLALGETLHISLRALGIALCIYVIWNLKKPRPVLAGI